MKHLKTGIFMLLIFTLTISGAAYAQENDSYTIGILNITGRLQDAAVGFMDGMTELGYIEGENVRYLYDGPLEDLDSDQWPEMAQALVDADVDLLFATSGDEAQILQELTDTIPIVFSLSSDPIGAGLVESFTDPGGNITGIETAHYHERRLQLLLEMDPSIELVYYPYNPEGTGVEEMLAGLEEMADQLEIQLVTAAFTDVASVREALEDMPEDADAVFFSPEGLLFQYLPDWVEAAMQLQAGISIPAYLPMPGILMGYGPDPFAGGEQAAGMVDRILRGADPADLPVESAEYFLMVNLETAEMIGIDLPRGILRQADLIVRPGDFDMDEQPESDE
jgi:putative ABC transport system substrate-binding protein